MKTFFDLKDPMAGTEGTGEYRVVAVSTRGRVGVRSLGNGFFRVRVEPAPGMSEASIGAMAKHLSHKSGWKQPDSNGQRRWSKMTGNQLAVVVATAATALGRGKLASFAEDSTVLETLLASAAADDEESNGDGKVAEGSEPESQAADS
jgi:hypothetical protein